MFAQRDAIIRLLSDDDPATVELVKNKLADGGVASIANLEELIQSATVERVSRHAAEVLARIQGQKAADEFGALCQNFDDQGDIEAASWLLAGALLPGVQLHSFQATLDHWGERVAGPMARATSATAQVEALSSFLGDEIGLVGNSDDYYRLENSLLPTVIESRLGIPISLSLVYMLVGRRAGVAVEGVGLPGHFIARIGNVLFDPFHGGTIIPWAACEALVGEQNLNFTREPLRPFGSLRLLIRILTNLHYVTEQDGPRHRQITGWITALGKNVTA